MMLYRKIMDANGDFQSQEGTRYSVCSARRVRNSDGVNVGYEEFSSLEEALEAWNLMHESAVTQISVGNENQF